MCVVPFKSPWQLGLILGLANGFLSFLFLLAFI